MFYKNTASQKLIVFAFDTTTATAKTGDGANITAYVSKDYGSVTVLGDTSATEADSTNAKGYYLFDLAQAETNAEVLMFSAKSSTANIVVIGAPAIVLTMPTTGVLSPATLGRTAVVDASGLIDANAVKCGATGAGTAITARDIGASVLLSTGTGAGQLDFTSGVVKANATQWLGGTIPAVNVTGVPLVDNKYLLGTVISTPATAGIFDVNVKNMNNVAGTAITTIKAVQGLTTADTIATYTGNTVQTGDAFARLGVAGVGLTNLGDTRIAHLDADISSRTKPADTQAAVTNLTNAPTAGDFTATMKTSIGTAVAASAVASVTGSVGSVTGLTASNLDTTVSSRLASSSYTAPDNISITAIKAKTDNLPAAPAAVGDIPTANQNADALLDRAAGVETGITPRQSLRLMLASLAGKLSGAAGTTVSIRDTNDSKNRIVATVDSNGNRSAVTLDAS